MAAEQHASSNGGTPIAKTAEQPVQLLDTSAEARVVESSQLSTSDRKLRLAEVLVAKTEQGYRIESQTDTEATLTTKGHRRWLGMVGSNSETREITSIDEQGRTRTRPA
jgi:hypothetical protein